MSTISKRSLRKRVRHFEAIISLCSGKYAKGGAIFVRESLIMRDVFPEYGDIPEDFYELVRTRISDGIHVARECWNGNNDPDADDHDPDAERGLYLAPCDEMISALVSADKDDLKRELKVMLPHDVTSKQFRKAAKRIRKAEALLGKVSVAVLAANDGILG